MLRYLINRVVTAFVMVLLATLVFVQNWLYFQPMPNVSIQSGLAWVCAAHVSRQYAMKSAAKM